MFEKDMLPVLIVVAIFALLAYDITANNGAWATGAMDFADDIWRDLQHLIHV
jgi:hypothetical protein